MYDVYLMSMSKWEPEADLIDILSLPAIYKSTRYYGSHLETITRIVEKAKTEYIWVLSDVCDYYSFGWDFVPAPWETDQIHCWASGDQQQGDTFLIPVEQFKAQLPLDRLEYFQDIHYHFPGAPRRLTAIQAYTDNLPAHVNKCTFDNIYTMFYQFEKESMDDCADPNGVQPSLWKDRAIYPLNKSGSCVLVPNACIGRISTQLYDYPYISREFDDYTSDEPLDVVFISNGELNADKHHESLRKSLYPPKENVPTPAYVSRDHHIEGVDGRMAAYKAAAEASTTPWFFAVFAKCDVDPDFDFSWQPDAMQQDKHYIFHAKNPVNGLEYGHMAIIAYNRKLVLDSVETGLDFTLSAEHAVVPIVSCTARYNDSELATWRTAFREALKLKQTVETDTTVEAEYRLHTWCNVAEGDFAEYSLAGANEAVEFYNEVGGEQEQLMQSYEWAWLNHRFENRNQ